MPQDAIIELTEDQERQERALLRRDLRRQEADDEQRWGSVVFTGDSPDPARAKKCAEEREEYVKQRGVWVEKIVGPIYSKKKSKRDRERLEAEG